MSQSNKTEDLVDCIEQALISKSDQATNEILKSIELDKYDQSVVLALSRILKRNKYLPHNIEAQSIIVRLCSVKCGFWLYPAVAKFVSNQPKCVETVSLVKFLTNSLMYNPEMEATRLRFINNQEKDIMNIMSAWKIDPVSYLSICLLMSESAKAIEILSDLSLTEPSTDAIKELKALANHFESPVFTRHRYRMALGDTSRQRTPWFLLLALIPSCEEANKLFRKLSDLQLVI
ncbi:hypothetical protein ACOME3_005840 [Neoechinorhynchus agilis]